MLVVAEQDRQPGQEDGALVEERSALSQIDHIGSCRAGIGARCHRGSTIVRLRESHCLEHVPLRFVTPDDFDLVVVGGGLVGLATALAHLRARPDQSVAVLEKESTWGAHQSRRNSGVLHAGIYYAPGSDKARLCAVGRRAMLEFCDEHAIPVRVLGKFVVAVDEEELSRLDELERRAAANGVECHRVTAEELAEREPSVRSIGALHVPSTAVVDFGSVVDALVGEVARAGGVLMADTTVWEVSDTSAGKRLLTSVGEVGTRRLVTCAGLHSDRLARLDGLEPGVRIIPFRGEYFDLTGVGRSLVSTPVYPVPRPPFPFLGVHFTPTVGGGLHVGPNAVLALRREGYRALDIDPSDLLTTLAFPGTWRLARSYRREGAAEMVRSLSTRLFLRAARRLVPDLRLGHMRPAAPGVRAQAVDRRGALVDDFLVVRGRRSMHVCNAPSPAATASLAIGRELVGQLLDDS